MTASAKDFRAWAYDTHAKTGWFPVCSVGKRRSGPALGAAPLWEEGEAPPGESTRAHLSGMARQAGGDAATGGGKWGKVRFSSKPRLSP